MYNDMINAYEQTIGFATILMALREIEQGREGERKGKKQKYREILLYNVFLSVAYDFDNY